jgi:hypothetical protein
MPSSTTGNNGLNDATEAGWRQDTTKINGSPVRHEISQRDSPYAQAGLAPKWAMKKSEEFDWNLMRI